MTVGVMVIPQGLSFAVVANVPPVHGLYVAMMTSFVYFLLGSSKYLIVGPTAVLSLLVGGFSKQGASTSTFLADALLLSLLSGLILMVLSFLRLGFLTALLSKPIGVGFTAGAAILIACSQVKHIFGISMDTPETIIVLVKEIVHLARSGTSKVNGWAVLIFFLCFAYIIILKQIKYTKMIPGPLFALAMATLASWGFNLPSRVGLAVVGHVPKGLPSPSVPVSSWADVGRALPYSFVVAFLCFVEAFTIAKPLAIKEGIDLNANQELFALGSANVIGSFFSSFPAAGSFTRTAVNFSVGAKSQFSGFVSAIVVLISILFLTPSLHFLPYSVLAAIVMSGVINLFEWHDMIYIYKTKKRDFAVLVSSFLLVLLMGVDTGVLLSIALHVLLLVVATIKMRVEELVDSGDGLFVHLLDDPFSHPVPGIILAKVTDSLVYLNIESFMKQVEALLKTHGSLLPESTVKKVIRVSSIEATPIDTTLNSELDIDDSKFLLDDDQLNNGSPRRRTSEFAPDSSHLPRQRKKKSDKAANGGPDHTNLKEKENGLGLIEGEDSEAEEGEKGEKDDGKDSFVSKLSMEEEKESNDVEEESKMDYESRKFETEGEHDEGDEEEGEENGDLDEGEEKVALRLPNAVLASDAVSQTSKKSTSTSSKRKKNLRPGEEDDPVRKLPNAIVFDFSMVNAVDSSAMFRLEELRKILATEGYSMHFAHVHSAVLEVMYRGDFLEHLGANGLFISLRDSLDFLLSVKDKRMVTIFARNDSDPELH